MSSGKDLCIINSNTITPSKSKNKKIQNSVPSSNDALYVNFRDDDIFLALQQFATYGLTMKDLKLFQNEIPIYYPWNQEYNTFRINVNRCYNKFPLMIIMAKHKKDVYQGFLLAKKYKIPFVLRGGSHSFAGLSLCNGIVLDQSIRNQIYIDVKNQTVKVGAGVLLGPMANELYKKGFFLPMGLCPNNCVSGFTLGGGIGMYTRTLGVTADSLLSSTMILADGRITNVNKNNHPDLFWAIRGGGGNIFGINLDFTFKIYPIDKVYVFYLKYDPKKIIDIIKTWQNLYSTFPEYITIDLRLLTNGEVASVSGIYRKNDRQELQQILRPFLDLTPSDIFMENMTYIESVKYFGGSGRWGLYFDIKSGFITKDLPDQALEIFERYMFSAVTNSNVSFKMLGGTNDKLSPDKIAFPHRNVRAWFLIDGQWNDENQGSMIKQWVTNFYREISPYLGEGVYVNSPDLSLKNYLRSYYLGNLEQLVKIKRKYDPNNIFCNEQSIPTSL